MVRSTDSLHPVADAGSIDVSTADAGVGDGVIGPGRRLDLRPFEDVMPLLSKDVEARYGRRTRLSPIFVKERPFSYVMRAGIWHDGDSGPREHLFVKVSKPKEVDGSPNGMLRRVEKDFAVTERVFARMAGGDAYGAVRPFAYYPAHLAIVTEEVPGETLLDLLQRDIRWSFSASPPGALLELMTAAGRWIKDFQEPSSQTMPDSWVEEYIDRRLRLIAATGREGERLRTRILDHVRQTVARTGTGPVAQVTVHADLSPSNVMVSAGKVVILDFAMSRLGHPLQDVARLYSQVGLLAMKPQFRRRVIVQLQRALLRGFDPSLDARDQAFRLQLLLQRVNHLASLSTRRYFWTEALYNRWVRRQHRLWIERETAGGGKE